MARLYYGGAALLWDEEDLLSWPDVATGTGAMEQTQEMSIAALGVGLTAQEMEQAQEMASGALGVGLTASDMQQTQEMAGGALGQTAAAQVVEWIRAEFEGRGPAASFSGRGPSMVMAGRGPSVTFEAVIDE